MNGAPGLRSALDTDHLAVSSSLSFGTLKRKKRRASEGMRGMKRCRDPTVNGAHSSCRALGWDSKQSLVS